MKAFSKRVPFVLPPSADEDWYSTTQVVEHEFPEGALNPSISVTQEGDAVIYSWLMPNNAELYAIRQQQAQQGRIIR